MSETTAGERGFADALRDEVGDALRSVTVYTRDGYEILYIRPDVREQYTDAALDEAIAETRLEALEREYVNDVFRETHGPLRSSVKCFADAVELNLILSETTGVAVAVDADWFGGHRALVREARELARGTDLSGLVEG